MAGQWGTRARSIRIPQDRWDTAKACAAARGETVSDVVNRALEEYPRSTVAEPTLEDSLAVEQLVGFYPDRGSGLRGAVSSVAVAVAEQLLRGDREGTLPVLLARYRLASLLSLAEVRGGTSPKV